MISTGLPGQLSAYGRSFNLAIFLNVKFGMMIVLIELYPFIPLSVTLTVFQDHRSIYFLWKFRCTFWQALLLYTVQVLSTAMIKLLWYMKNNKKKNIGFLSLVLHLNVSCLSVIALLVILCRERVQE